MSNKQPHATGDERRLGAGLKGGRVGKNVDEGGGDHGEDGHEAQRGQCDLHGLLLGQVHGGQRDDLIGQNMT